MHTYIGIEDLGLTVPQRQTLIEALKKLGPASHPQPSHLCHHRIRLDGKAANKKIAKMDAEEERKRQQRIAAERLKNLEKARKAKKH